MVGYPGLPGSREIIHVDVGVSIARILPHHSVTVDKRTILPEFIDSNLSFLKDRLTHLQAAKMPLY